jgi:enolase
MRSLKENYMRKNAFFKALSLLLIFSFSLSNISYAAGGDIRDCLAVASGFNPLSSETNTGIPNTGGEPAEFAGSDQIPSKIAAHMMIGLIADSLRSGLDHPVDTAGIRNLIGSHFKPVLGSDLFTNIEWQDIYVSDVLFPEIPVIFLPITLGDQTVELEFSRVNEASGPGNFLNKIKIGNDGLVNINLLSAERGKEITPDVIAAVKAALGVGDVPVVGEAIQITTLAVEEVVPTEASEPATEAGATEEPDDTPPAALEKGWVIANHILVSFHVAFISSVLALPSLAITKGEVLKFIFLSPETIISALFLYVTWHVGIAVHEMGHYLKAVEINALEPELLPAAQAQMAKPFHKKIFWYIKMFLLIPWGKFEGVDRTGGLNYHPDAPYNLAVSAAGPRTSFKLAKIALPIAVVGITAGLLLQGWWLHWDWVLNIGRLALGLGAVGILDRFIADEGKYREFEARERAAGEAAGEVTALAEGDIRWMDMVPEAMKKMQRSEHMQEVVRHDKKRVTAPWGFRNCGMGGRHTEKEYPESNISMQEMMFIPLKAESYGEAQEMIVALQTRLKEIIENAEGCRVLGIGLEGGLAPYIKMEEGDIVPEQRLWRMAAQTIMECGYSPGEDVVIALDPASSELEIAFRKEKGNPKAIGQYLFWRDKAKVVMDRTQVFNLFRYTIQEEEMELKSGGKLIGLPIISIEDGFGEKDDKGWAMLMDAFGRKNSEFGKKLFIIGDDSITTKDSSIEHAADNGLCNSALIKANQIGTLMETVLAILVALGKGLDVVISHRSKSPIDDMEAQIALAAHAMGLKAGGGSNTERLHKYGAVADAMAEAMEEGEKAVEEKIREVAEERSIQEQRIVTYDEVIKSVVITALTAKEEPTNAGIPTVLVKITIGLEDPKTKIRRDIHTFKGATPLGTSAGTDEAIHLVDSVIYTDQIPAGHEDKFEESESKDGSYRFMKKVTMADIEKTGNLKLQKMFMRAKRYKGMGCLNAVDHVKKILAPGLVGTKFSALGNMAHIDATLLALEKIEAKKRKLITNDSSAEDQIAIMQRKGNIGMNAILSQSLAMARAAAWIQGKELWEILRETLTETMAKTIDASKKKLGNLPEDVAQRVIDHKREGQKLWQAINEELTFEELQAGLQAVNENRGDVPLYKLLREQLPVYSDAIKKDHPPENSTPTDAEGGGVKKTIWTGYANAAKMQGKVSHEVVNTALERAIIEGRAQEAGNELRKLLEDNRKNIGKKVGHKLGKRIKLDKILELSKKTRIVLVEDPKNIPALVLRDRYNYQVAHVGLEKESIYLPRALVESLAKDDPELLAVLLSREITLLNEALKLRNKEKTLFSRYLKALKFRKGNNYDEVVKKAEESAEKKEKTLIEKKLDEYIQKKVDAFVLAQTGQDDEDAHTVIRQGFMKREEGAGAGSAYQKFLEIKKLDPEGVHAQMKAMTSILPFKKKKKKEDPFPELFGDIKLVLMDDPENKPALVLKDSDDYQVAHVEILDREYAGVERNSIFLSKALVESLEKDDPGLLSALLIKQMMRLNKARELYNGSNYEKAMEEANRSAKTVERRIVGIKLEECIQNKIDDFVVKKVVEQAVYDGKQTDTGVGSAFEKLLEMDVLAERNHNDPNRVQRLMESTCLVLQGGSVPLGSKISTENLPVLFKDIKLVLIKDPENAPALVLRNRDNYRFDYVDLEKKTIYLSKDLAESLTEEDPMLLATLLIKKAAFISRASVPPPATELVEGHYRRREAKKAKIFAKDLEKTLIGKRLAEAIQKKVNAFVDAKKPTHEKANLAKKTGDVSSEEVNAVIKWAYEDEKERVRKEGEAFRTLSEMNALVKKTKNPEKLQELLNKTAKFLDMDLSELFLRLSEKRLVLIKDLESKPALVIKGRDDHQVAHVGFKHNAVYLTESLFDLMRREAPELLAALLIRELVMLNKVEEYHKTLGQPYDEAVENAERDAEALEQELVGGRLDEYIQFLVNDFLQRQDAAKPAETKGKISREEIDAVIRQAGRNGKLLGGGDPFRTLLEDKRSLVEEKVYLPRLLMLLRGGGIVISEGITVRAPSIFLIDDPEKTPALVLRNRDNYRVGHVDLEKAAIYLPKGLVESLSEEDPGLLAALVLNKLEVLSKASSLYALGANLDDAVEKAEKSVEAGGRLKAYIQDKVDDFIVKQKIKTVDGISSDFIGRAIEAATPARDPEKPNTLILFVDDMVKKGAVVDLEKTLGNTDFQDRKVMTNGVIVLYAKKEGKNPDELEKLEMNTEAIRNIILRSDNTIGVTVVSEEDLPGAARVAANHRGEMQALTDVAIDELKRKTRERLRASKSAEAEKNLKFTKERVLGIIRGPNGDINGMADIARTLEVPVVVFSDTPGIHSFAQAFHAAIKSRQAGGRWYVYLEPIELLEVDKLRDKFEAYVRQVLVKA